MSLQRKFIVLLAMLGLTVLGSLSATIWTFAAQHRALAGPFKDAPQFLDSLSEIQHQVTAMTAAIRATESPELFLPTVPNDIRQEWERRPPYSPPNDGSGVIPASPPDPIQSLAGGEFARHAVAIDRELQVMSDSDLFISSGSESAIKAISALKRRMTELAPEWFEHRREPVRADMLALAARVLEVSSQIRLRVLDDRSRGIDFSNAIVDKLVTVLISAAGSSLLLGVLALVLVHRWVLRPVRELRLAAAQIGKGRFEHQIPVQGSDELARLSDEVNHMALTIRHMLDERVDRERLAALGEMMRRLAHNLRNPLSGIRGLAEVTRNELPPASDLREHQERILKAVDRFEQWLSELLNATRPLQLHFEPTDTRRFVAHVIDTHRAMALAKGVGLELVDSEAPPTVVCDAAQLEHAIVAILTNAIQASPRGGNVRFAVGLNPEDAQWELRISDQGPGVAPELREKIFLPYFTTKKDGTGIGLAMALQVVRGHGGRILLEPGLEANEPSIMGPGCTFVVLLPVEPTTSAPPAELATTHPGGSGVPRAQDPDHRGRREPAVLHPSNAGKVRSIRL